MPQLTDYWDLIKGFRTEITLVSNLLPAGTSILTLTFQAKHLVDILHMFQLLQLTNSDTKITPTSSTCINQTPQIIKSIEALSEICSDHCVLRVIVINNTDTDYCFKRTIYNYDKLDANKLCNIFLV